MQASFGRLFQQMHMTMKKQVSGLEMKLELLI